MPNFINVIPNKSDLLKLFRYENGNLYWLEKRRGIKNILLPAGTVNSHGYRQIQIDGKIYKAHRLIWAFHFDVTIKIIDHQDGDLSNNKIENLRESSYSQNMFNRKPNRDCSSEYKGVRFSKRTGKWIAEICANGKRQHIGYFHQEIDAVKAYDDKAKYLHGEFGKLNNATI